MDFDPEQWGFLNGYWKAKEVRVTDQRGRKRMPKLKSSKKRLAKSITLRARNRSHVSAVRTAVKNVFSAGDAESAQQALISAISVIDKTARKGIIHSNRAARTKARLSKRVAGLA